MKISLKKKKLTSGRLSLYLEYYKGYSIDSNGRKKHDRSFEYLKLYLYENPSTTQEKNENKETLNLAKNILTLKNAELIKGEFNMADSNKGKVLFLDYYNKLKEERYESKGNYDNWDAALKHLERFCSPSLAIKDIDEGL
ncbi:phage integrase SAM-like domain-containing protein [Formosa sp. PL04]|uniref:phage integrase SAM-like domain-containing protein n=1 Tax=Formosa sp. PL04 TaxID=3081755 RepID=UPI0029817BA6|nr:phage integrase SAM-like domain-containing protein [Formosa sp. PL04]MDW5288157.1 phage integrase SAM-like domain-containing protein [Formosa sp. PL04]